MNREKTLRWLKQKRVAVLKGGWSRERAVSLKTGKAVENAFRSLGIPFTSIYVKKDFKTRLKKHRIQFCFLALHGTFGEDGEVQRHLEQMKISYTGSGPLSSSLAINKDVSKGIFRNNKVPTADWIAVLKHDAFHAVTAFLKQGPAFIKPWDQGSAIGVSRVKTLAQAKKALKACFQVSDVALVERFVAGREFTVGILGPKALPVVEIIPEHSFYDYHSKYAKGGSRHVVPARLSAAQTRRAQKISLAAFKSLQCKSYGRVDLIRNKKGEFFVLEVNTIPGMTEVSLLPDAAKAAGISFNNLVLDIVRYSR